MDTHLIRGSNINNQEVSPLLRGAASDYLTSTASLHTIFVIQLSSWVGNGMKVSVRSNEKCRDCDAVFNEGNSFYCKTHDRHAQKVYIEITGLKDTPTGRIKIYSDLQGFPLHKATCFGLKSRIIQEIENKTFSLKRYLPRNKKFLLFENYAKKYLDDIYRRAKLQKGVDGWITSGYEADVEWAFRCHLVPFFGEFDIDSINSGLVEDFKNSLKVADKTKQNIIAILSNLFTWAKRREDILSIPIMPRIRYIPSKKKGLMEDGQSEIMKYISKEHKLIFQWAIETGRRINEYRAMKVKDVDWKGDIYRIGGAFDREHYKEFPKNPLKKGEEFPLTEELKKILRGALKDRICNPEDFIFLNRGKAYTGNALRHIFIKARKKAGYTVTLNEFGRHSMGLQLRQAGASYSDIADILGNTVEVAKNNYSHCESARKAKILELRENVRGMSVARILRK